MPRIFISYRRADSKQFTHRLAKDLKNHYGIENIFIDVEDHNILPGLDFIIPILEAIEDSDVVLAIIAENWVSEIKKRQNDVDDEEDILVLELEHAFQKGVPIIPILVDDANMPSKNVLPSSMIPFARLQAHVIHSQEKYYESEFAELLEIIPKLLARYNEEKSDSSRPVELLDIYMAWDKVRKISDEIHRDQNNLLYDISVAMSDAVLLKYNAENKKIVFEIQTNHSYQILANTIRRQWIKRKISEMLNDENIVIVYTQVQSSLENQDQDYSDITLNMVRKSWVEAQRMIFQYSFNAGDLIVNLPNLMEHAIPVWYEEGLLTLQVDNQIYLDKLQDKTRIKWVERALAKIFNIDIKIQYVKNGSQPQTLDDIPF